METSSSELQPDRQQNTSMSQFPIVNATQPGECYSLLCDYQVIPAVFLSGETHAGAYRGLTPSILTPIPNLDPLTVMVAYLSHLILAECDKIGA
jgi:hypothetical protein